MKYVILIHSNPESRRIWASFSDAEKETGWKYYAALDAELAATGELIVSEALDDPATGKRVAATMPTDGPFAEVKEHLAGFYLLECESMERAMQIAQRIPEAELGLVEVRPVISLGQA